MAREVRAHHHRVDEEIAGAVAYLAGSFADYINVTAVRVDGGHVVSV